MGMAYEYIEQIDMLRAARVAGRHVTAIGGGTGLSTLLLGLKEYTDNITAVVTVTDDGGGSGVIRREFGVLPPGDIRNCLLALANAGDMMSELINYRFTGGSLDGQSLGNLLLLALDQICGSFDLAVAKMNQILAVTGQVLPVTNENISLRAYFEDGSTVDGETAITAAKKINGLKLSSVAVVPHDACALDSVIEAIEQADVIILGPGSLYTSVISNLLVGSVAKAVMRSRALKLYVLNIMTQEGETEGYSAIQHVREIERHAGGRLVDACIANTMPVHPSVIRRYAGENCVQLFPNMAEFAEHGVRLVGGDMLSRGGQLARHDPLRLAYYIMRAAHELRPRGGLSGEYDKLLLDTQ